MKVVILCGGRGTRLSEETTIIPKPMVDIGGKPMLWHIMHIYAHYGFKDFILCLGYKGEIIKNFFYNYKVLQSNFTVNLGSNDIQIHNNHNQSDWAITLVDTGLDNQTGSRIKQIEKYIDGDEFMLTYGDGLCDIDISKLYKFHKKSNKIVTITGVRPRSRYGELKVSNIGIVTEFNEKPAASQGYINGGFFVLNKNVFKYLKKDRNQRFEGEPLRKITVDKNLSMYYHDGFWEGVDTIRELGNMRSLWEKNKAPWKVWK